MKYCREVHGSPKDLEEKGNTTEHINIERTLYPNGNNVEREKRERSDASGRSSKGETSSGRKREGKSVEGRGDELEVG